MNSSVLDRPTRFVGVGVMTAMPNSATTLTTKRCKVEKFYVANNSAGGAAIVTLQDTNGKILFRATVDPLTAGTQGQVLLTDGFWSDAGIRWSTDVANDVFGMIEVYAEGVSG